MRRLPTLLLAAIAMSLAAPGVPRPTPSLERTLETHHVFARALAEGERVRKAGLLTVLGLVGLAAVVGKYEMEGPIEAEVVRVVDGDTLTVRARIWIGQELTTNVRLSGVNAPELAGSCEEERALAQTARRFLAERVEGRPVRLRKRSASTSSAGAWSHRWRMARAISPPPSSPPALPFPMMAAAESHGASDDGGGRAQLPGSWRRLMRRAWL